LSAKSIEILPPEPAPPLPEPSPPIDWNLPKPWKKIKLTARI
jgi:hypothetical protein